MKNDNACLLRDEETPLMADNVEVNTYIQETTSGITIGDGEENSIISTMEDNCDPMMVYTNSCPKNPIEGNEKTKQKRPGRQSAVGFKEVDAVVVNEESSLLVKNNVANYSQRTTRTISTMSLSLSDSEDGMIVVPNDDKEDLESGQALNVLGSLLVFDNVHPEYEEQIPLVQEEVVDANSLSVVDEVNAVAEVLLEELHYADEGDSHFLEIGLTRNFSILPEDITDAAAMAQSPPPPLEHPTHEQHHDDHDYPQTPRDEENTEPKTRKTPFYAFVLLLGAVISLSAIGPLLKVQQGVSGTLKVVWRMAGTAIVLLPLAIVDVCRHGGLPKLTMAQWLTFAMSTASYAVFTVTFVLALDYTALGNVVILSNSLCLILLIGKLFVGGSVSFLEGMGAIIAFSGAALCSRDSAEARDTLEGGGYNLGYFGDALALLSALGGVGYLICAKASRAHIPMYLFMFLTMLLGCVMILIFETLVLAETVTFDMHPSHGFWGWLLLESDRLPLELVIVLVCNCFGTLGYIAALNYFDTLVISSATLAEPVVAEFMAFAMGVGTLPGFQGWMGNFLVALGTFAVIYDDCNRNKEGGKSFH